MSWYFDNLINLNNNYNLILFNLNNNYNLILFNIKTEKEQND